MNQGLPQVLSRDLHIESIRHRPYHGGNVSPRFPKGAAKPETGSDPNGINKLVSPFMSTVKRCYDSVAV
jgi:hypothetical protein